MSRILRSRRTWIITVIILAIGAFVVLSGRGAATKAAVKDKPVSTLEFSASDLTSITTRPVSHSLAVSGSLVAVNQATVKAKVAVEVRSISVREGDKVTAGQ